MTLSSLQSTKLRCPLYLFTGSQLTFTSHLKSAIFAFQLSLTPPIYDMTRYIFMCIDGSSLVLPQGVKQNIKLTKKWAKLTSKVALFLQVNTAHSIKCHTTTQACYIMHSQKKQTYEQWKPINQVGQYTTDTISRHDTFSTPSRDS